MDHEHDRDRHVAGTDEREQIGDVGRIRTRDHLGDEREDAVGRQHHDHVHELHDDQPHRFRELDDGLRALRVFTHHCQRRQSEEDAEDDDRNDGRRPRAREIEEHILRHEAHEHVCEAEARNTFIALLEDLCALELASTLGNGIGGEAEQVGDEDADQRRDHGGHDQDSDHRAANAAKRSNLPHFHDGRDHHYQHERHDDHAQQIHVRGTDHVGPLEGALNGGMGAAVGELKTQPVNNAGEQTCEDLARQGKSLPA